MGQVLNIGTLKRAGIFSNEAINKSIFVSVNSFSKMIIRKYICEVSWFLRLHYPFSLWHVIRWVFDSNSIVMIHFTNNNFLLVRIIIALFVRGEVKAQHSFLHQQMPNADTQRQIKIKQLQKSKTLRYAFYDYFDGRIRAVWSLSFKLNYIYNI